MLRLNLMFQCHLSGEIRVTLSDHPDRLVSLLSDFNIFAQMGRVSQYTLLSS